MTKKHMLKPKTRDDKSLADEETDEELASLRDGTGPSVSGAAGSAAVAVPMAAAAEVAPPGILTPVPGAGAPAVAGGGGDTETAAAGGIVRLDTVTGLLQGLLSQKTAEDRAHLAKVTTDLQTHVGNQIAQVSAEMGGKLDHLTQAVASQGARIDAHDNRFEALERDMAELRKQVQEGKKGSTDSEGFVPGFVEVEGWCRFEDRGAEGVTRDEIEEHMVAVKGKAPASIRAAMGIIQVGGYRNSRFRVLVANGRAPEVRDWMRELYEGDETMRIKGADMKVRVERSPEQKANLGYFLRGLRATEHRLAKLRAAQVDDEQDDRMEGQPGAKPDWRRWAITVGTLTVAHLPRGAQEVTWTADGLAFLKAGSGAELLAEVEGR